MSHPELLPLLVLVLLPLVLHLLDRRRARVVTWPSMRFLRSRSATRLRRLRAQEALLLIARSLAVLALVLALVQFHGETEVEVRSTRDGARLLILYLDTSPSTAWRRAEDDATVLEHARELAANVVAGAGDGDLFVVLDSSARSSAAAEGMDLLRGDTARERLAALEVSGNSFSLVRALERCAAVLDAFSEVDVELYVFSDFQASAFPEDDAGQVESLATRLAFHRDRAALALIDCGDTNARNGFVSALSPDGLAIVRGRPSSFVVALGGPPHSEADATEDRVSIALRHGMRTLVEASAAREEARGGITLEQSLTEAGLVPLTAAKERDRLPLDDERHLLANVLPHVAVVILSAAPAADERASARLLELALYPSGAGLAPPDVPFRVERTTALAADTLRDAHVVIVCPDVALGGENGDRLAAFVERGGGAFLLLDGSASQLAAWSEPLPPGFLPVGPPATDAGAPDPGREPLRVESFDAAHPALALFARPANGDLTAIRVRARPPLSPAGPGTRVLASLAGGIPWLLERAFGAGKVLVSTTSISPRDTDLSQRRLFVPLVHRLVAYLAASDPDQRSAELGTPLRWMLSARHEIVDVFAVDPLGARHEAAVSARDDGTEVIYEHARNPGFYRLFALDGTTQERHTASFAVNVAASESRLDAIARERMETLATLFDATLSRSPDAMETRSRMMLAERHLRVWFALAALVLLFVEALLARRLAAERDDR